MCDECLRPRNSWGQLGTPPSCRCVCQNGFTRAEGTVSQCGTSVQDSASAWGEAEQHDSRDLLSGDVIRPTRCHQPVCFGTGTDVWSCEACGFMAHQGCVPRAEWPSLSHTGYRCNKCTRAQQRNASAYGARATSPAQAHGRAQQQPDTHPGPHERRLWHSTPGIAGADGNPPQHIKTPGRDKQVLPTPGRFQALPSFAGTETEDPKAFIDDCTSRLARYGVCEEEWPTAVGGQLTGRARQWYLAVTRYGMTWTEFVSAFRLTFTSTFASLQARSQAVLQTQSRGESLTSFATKKMNLLKQFHPEMSGTEVLEVIAATALQEYRGSLAPLIHGTNEEFMRSVLLIDNRSTQEEADGRLRYGQQMASTPTPRADDKQERPAQRLYRPQEQRREAPHMTRPPVDRGDGSRDGRRQWDRTKPPPRPCRFCPGEKMHWHADCPNFPDQRGKRDTNPPPSGN